MVTPGGRFGKDAPGVRELAVTLAGQQQRVLIWDRPNCGASDVCFDGASESEMQADTLAGAARRFLDLGAGDAHGRLGRLSGLAPHRGPPPRRAGRLAMVWISGGVYGLLLLATHYCGESIRAAWQGGMEAVVELPEWAEVLERNPRNRQRFLALEPSRFIETLEHWMLVYCPEPDSTVPGLATTSCRGSTCRRSSSAVVRAIRTTPARRRRHSTG